MTVQAKNTDKRRGRPRKVEAKEKVTMMMHPGLRDHLRDLAVEDDLGYQSLAHQILADAVAKRMTYERGSSQQRLALLAHDLFELFAKASQEMEKHEAGKEWKKVYGDLRAAVDGLSALYDVDEE